MLKISFGEVCCWFNGWIFLLIIMLSYLTGIPHIFIVNSNMNLKPKDANKVLNAPFIPRKFKLTIKVCSSKGSGGCQFF